MGTRLTGREAGRTNVHSVLGRQWDATVLLWESLEFPLHTAASMGQSLDPPFAPAIVNGVWQVAIEFPLR
jgi:hypothetical protein